MSTPRKYPLEQAASRRSFERGFSLMELLVAIILGAVVLTSIYGLVLSQGRTYGKQLELMDVHGTLRGAASLLSSDLRQAASADLYTIGANAVALRSPRGTGIVCKRHATQPRFGIVATAGDLTASTDDSALVFAAGSVGSGDDEWKVMKVQTVITLPTCEWGGGSVPDLAVQLTVAVPADTAGIGVGAPIRVFRRTEYGLFQDGGRWWLGSKTGASSFEKLTGPLRSPTDGGLVFTYRDGAGNVTADPAQVRVVEIVIRAESHHRAGLGALEHQRDSVALRVALRG